MEPAKIDWKRIESRFVEDIVYEHINAPKWVDFLNPDGDSPDDVAWFCRPDCNHPKSVEDFLKTTPTSKVPSPAGGNATPSRADSTQRDPILKKRGQSEQKEDVENLNPNMSTPPCRQQAKATKAAFKCSSERRKPRDDNDVVRKEDVPRLRSTLSARNLFTGRDILNHITEFCNELKKLATGSKQRESNEEKMNDKRKKNNQETALLKQVSGTVLKDLNDKQRRSRIEASKENSENVKVGEVEKNLSQTLADEAENIPLSLNLDNVKRRGEQLLQIRTNPPSPQCFSAHRASIKTTPPKASQSRLAERGVLQELKPILEVKKDGPGSGVSKAANRSVSVVAGREAGPLDMFWFLKPCTVAD